MSTEYFYSVLAFFAFVFLVAFIRYTEGSWFSPSSVFALLWVLIIGASLVSAPAYYFSPDAICYFIGMVFLFFIGSRLAGNERIEKPNVGLKMLVNQYFLNIITKFLWIAIISGFISVFFLIKDSSLLIDDFSISSFQQMAEQFTHERYSGVRLSHQTMFFLMINYSGCMAAGWMTLRSKERLKKLFSTSVFIPILFFTFIYTARAILLYGIVMYVGTFLAAMNNKRKHAGIAINKFTIISVVSGIIFIPIVFIITQASRMGIEKFSFSSLTRLVDYLKVWFAGNISAFSIWFDSFQKHHLTMGQFTFGGLFELLNLSRREVGIYTVSYDVDGKMSFTNIYTIFRFLIDDLGLLGTCLFILLIGFVAKKLFINSEGGSLTSIAILGGILSFLMFSFISSIWAYNTVLFAWFIFVFLCFFIERIVLHAR